MSVELGAFMGKKSDTVATAEAIAAALDVALPMIEVMDFRKAGYLPEALVNYMALLGWSPGDDREIMPMPEMIEAFDVTRVNKTPARFDPEKLAWMNAQYMQRLPLDVLQERLAQWLGGDGVATWRTCRPRRARRCSRCTGRGPVRSSTSSGWGASSSRHLRSGRRRR